MKANGKYSVFAIGTLFLLAAVASHAQKAGVLAAEYYGEIGCAHCDLFEEKILPAAESRAGVDVRLEAFDILRADGYERCRKRLADLGLEFRIFPVLIIGNNVYQGNAAIEEGLRGELSHYAENGECLPRIGDGAGDETPDTGKGWLRPEAVPVFLAGLADGINPCAFTTLLFFLSFLSLRGGTRGRIACVGFLFALGVFVSYFLIGLGLFNAIRAGSRISRARFFLRLATAGAAAAFCALTVRDLWLMRRGKPSDMKLQLSPAVKRRIHASVRGGIRGAFLPLGAFASGVVVAVLELACTGQVYFPTLSFMAQTDRSWMGMRSLLLYNLAFISPLVLVLILIFLGIGQDRIRGFFERNIGVAKAALAVVFAALAVLVWFF